MVGCSVNNTEERMWKGAVAALFEGGCDVWKDRGKL
jgi:hypothetical protein